MERSKVALEVSQSWAGKEQKREGRGRRIEFGAALENDPRWAGIERRYTAADVERLRGSVRVEHTLARLGAERLWELLHEEKPVAALGCLTGNQAVQAVKAGLKAIYLSGWQVAADANVAGQMYPDQSLYPVNSVPAVVERINNALRAPIKSIAAKAATARIGLSRSSLMRKRDSAEHSTSSN